MPETAASETSGGGFAARLIHDARRDARLTQRELAEKVGLPQSVISSYENGLRQPTLPSLHKILSAIGSHLSVIGSPGYETPQEGRNAEPSRHIDTLLLRARIEEHLREQGFHVRNGRLITPLARNKSELRALHAEAVVAQRERSRNALARLETRFLGRLASGTEIIPERIRPALVPVLDRRGFEGMLFRWCALHWSIPVSSGYGRRIRFLIVDRAHDNKIIGLLGLADPVFALGCRDTTIGWSRDQRTERLACVMDAFVLGAVPPYSDLCGGKLAALLATSREVQDVFAERYGGRQTLISQRAASPVLALVTTSSALGRSSVYNRLTLPGGRLAFQPVGYTSGTGDFHFSGGIYRELADHAAKITGGEPTQRHERWTGSAFRNRREVIQRALGSLGYDSRKLRVHGVRRQVFLAPLATNSFAWLRGEADTLASSTLDCDTLGSWWVQRWAIGRAARTETWRQFEPDAWRLYT